VENIRKAANDVHANRNSLKDPIVKGLINRLTPYAKSLPGTVPHIKCERRKLLAMISSDVVRRAGRFTWFISMAYPAPYTDDVFNVLLATHNPLHEASSDVDVFAVREKVDELTRSTRMTLLGDHPALALRLSKLRVNAVWKLLIVDSAAQPLGRVSDVWMRTEFQGRLIDHIHAMVAISSEKARPGSIHENKRSLPDIMETEVRRSNISAVSINTRKYRMPDVITVFSNESILFPTNTLKSLCSFGVQSILI